MLFHREKCELLLMIYIPQALVSINGELFLPLTIARCSAIYLKKNGHLRFTLSDGIIYA